jgi:hypothetical protein
MNIAGKERFLYIVTRGSLTRRLTFLLGVLES